MGQLKILTSFFLSFRQTGRRRLTWISDNSQANPIKSNNQPFYLNQFEDPTKPTQQLASEKSRRKHKSKLQISPMAASNIVKYGIVGVGMMGREHLINLHHLRTEGVAVVAIADPHVPSQKLALDLAQSFNWPIKVWTLLQSLNCLIWCQYGSPPKPYCKLNTVMLRRLLIIKGFIDFFFPCY